MLIGTPRYYQIAQSQCCLLHWTSYPHAVSHQSQAKTFHQLYMYPSLVRQPRPSLWMTSGFPAQHWPNFRFYNRYISVVSVKVSQTSPAPSSWRTHLSQDLCTCLSYIVIATQPQGNGLSKKRDAGFCSRCVVTTSVWSFSS